MPEYHTMKYKHFSNIGKRIKLKLLLLNYIKGLYLITL